MATVENELLDGIKDRLGKCEGRLDKHDERICRIENNCSSHEPILASIDKRLEKIENRADGRVEQTIRSIVQTIAIAVIMIALKKAGLV